MTLTNGYFDFITPISLVCIAAYIIFAIVLHCKRWIYKSLFYFNDRRKCVKLLDTFTDKEVRDYWLDNKLLQDGKYWYHRSLEKYIRKKYINSIIESYGEIRIN